MVKQNALFANLKKKYKKEGPGNKFFFQKLVFKTVPRGREAVP